MDFDGVVVDSEPLYEVAMNKQFKKYGIKVGPEDWLFFKGKDAKAVFLYIDEKFHSKVNLECLKRDYQIDLLDEFKRNMRYIPGFLDLFNACRTQFQDVLVTSTSRKIMEWTFENISIDNIFSMMITSTEVQNTKPHPEPYLMAAEKIGIPIQECIIIEDSVNGIRSGKAAGAKVIAISTTFDKSILHEADMIVSDYAELSPEILIHLLQAGR